MQVLPSKELLSAVLGINCTFVDKLCGNQLGFKTDNKDFTHLINIYELAHKCKKWANKKYFIDIDSHSGCARWGAEAVSHNGRPSVFYEQVFIGRTEPEAIFKACEWIMEQTKCGS